jgi:steroid delta-isomerase-like uncharacterized protein
MPINRELITAWETMLTSHQFDGISRVYAPLAVFEDVAMHTRCAGHAAIRQFFQDSVTAFPDFKMTVHVCVVDATMGASEWTMAGTSQGHAFGIAPTGRAFSIRGSSYIRFYHGRIVQQRDYWSLQQFKDQLGLSET